jgi:hypothetical protein
MKSKSPPATASPDTTDATQNRHPTGTLARATKCLALCTLLVLRAALRRVGEWHLMSLFALYHTSLECVDFADGRFGLEHFLLLQPLGSIDQPKCTCNNQALFELPLR